MAAKIVVSVNATWNLINFRSGLIAALQEDGHEIVALTPDDDHVRELAPLGVRHRAVDIDSSGTSPLRDAALFGRYVRVLAQERPAVYLGYTAKPNIYGSLAAQLLGIPTINNISGLGTAFMSAGALNQIVSRLYRISLRRASTVFFQNEEDCALFVTRRLVDKARAQLLPGSGIDLTRFRAAPPCARADRAPAFLLIARLLRDKGVVEYADAAQQLRRRYPDAQFRLLGFLDVANRTAISRAEVDRWVAEGAIDYLGETDDVAPFIASADCVVLPSYREGLPRTLLEASAMARPLIATDVPGCRQVVDDGDNGFLCSARDAVSLAAAMERMILLGHDARVAMGLRARAKAEAVFDDRIIYARYKAAIARALDHRR